MKWNWQQPDWPRFSYQRAALADLEARFLRQSGVYVGAMKHVSAGDKDTLVVDLMSTEALKTSEIEGEILDCASLQSSIRRNFGLVEKTRKIPPAEQGIAEMMVDLYKTFKKPLSHEQLFAWHKMLMKGRRDLHAPGAYRTHVDPMQVVSGPLHKPTVHFEAPPSKTWPIFISSVFIPLKTATDVSGAPSPKKYCRNVWGNRH
jgi:Fic family protein